MLVLDKLIQMSTKIGTYSSLIKLIKVKKTFDKLKTAC